MTAIPMPAGALFTDLYEIAMLRAYAELGMTERAVFSLFVRELPERRNFLLACGLADLLNEIEALRFNENELRYLAALGSFPQGFLDWLSKFRFTGDIYAMPEGTPFFANEPILEIVAPIAEAQLLETLVLNQIGLQTILASKAVRFVCAARGRGIVDFGARRAQGIDAATKGARAFFVAGVEATSNLAAGNAYGIPVAGTMAHSFVEACGSEAEAFENYARVFPDTTLLVDTYDTIAGVKKVIALARALRESFMVRAVRLDSGDLDQLSRAVRRLLDEAGLRHVHIVASGGLDEEAVDRLAAAGAPIDVFGVGTDMAVAKDAPALDIAYKLTEYAGLGRMKLSPGKRTLPGRKQVFRQMREAMAARDVIARADEALDGAPLLRPVMRAGRRLDDVPRDIAQIRDDARAALAALPPALKELAAPATPYEAAISGKLAELEREVARRIARG